MEINGGSSGRKQTGRARASKPFIRSVGVDGTPFSRRLPARSAASGRHPESRGRRIKLPHHRCCRNSPLPSLVSFRAASRGFVNKCTPLAVRHGERDTQACRHFQSSSHGVVLWHGCQHCRFWSEVIRLERLKEAFASCPPRISACVWLQKLIGNQVGELFRGGGSRGWKLVEYRQRFYRSALRGIVEVHQTSRTVLAVGGGQVPQLSDLPLVSHAGLPVPFSVVTGYRAAQILDLSLNKKPQLHARKCLISFQTVVKTP